MTGQRAPSAPPSRSRVQSNVMTTLILLVAMLTLGLSRQAVASIAYGSLNNFDCVNDTGVEAHGFDIELDDINSTAITYTYDYNHYGVPVITQDTSDPLHPKVLVRYVSGKNPDGTWKAYTAIPSGPIAPTMGHQFTNPAVNFGGEHFGVGYYGAPSVVKYNWLIDDGTGSLIHGPAVNVSTPTFVYNPPVAAQPAQVVAVIVPPPPPAPPVYEFGEACWVKEIKTTSHNPGKVQLQDLVGGDPGQPQPWANGEAPEVEIEWRIMQTQFAAADGGKNGQLAGAPEDLPGGDEVITRRYEFYKYLGPFDAETHEAMADAVAADGLHGVGSVTYADHFDANIGEWVTVTTDLSTLTVVGDFFGAQMSGFDVAPNLGLIDHVQDGVLGVPYPDRTVVVSDGSPFLAIIKTGALPDGMSLDSVTGVLSGTPNAAGAFNFTVEASELGGAVVSKAYTLTVPGGVVPVTFAIATSASPAAGGTISGDGNFNSGDNVTVHAVANLGFNFVNWTEGGVQVSASADYSFVVSADRTLVANFAALDITPPTTTLSLAGPLDSHGNYAGPVTVTLSAFDDLSGVASTFYKIEGGGQNTYSAPFLVSGPTGHVVWYWSVDNAGNVEATHNKTIVIANPVLASITVAPRKVIGGGTAVVTVTLTGPAPAAGTNVQLLSQTPSAAVITPATVKVPAGATYATAVLTTYPVAADTLVTLWAKAGGSHTCHVTVAAPTIKKVQVLPTKVIGGAGLQTGTVTLTGPVAVDTTIAISTDNANAIVPGTVTVTAGSSTATFQVTTKKVTVAIPAVITATGATNAASYTITIKP